MPPHQTGMPLSRHTSCTARASRWPPTRPSFDIDDAARADRYRLAGVLGGMNRLIQADWSTDVTLQFRMVNHVFVVKRLFEHHDVEGIHLPKAFNIVEGVCRICIAHQEDAGKYLTNLPNDFDIPARLDLDFDSAVAFVQFYLNDLKQPIDRRLDSD
jgi:hypothetical protein